MSVYNCRSYIEACVNSILTQTFSDFEFVIVDDCSTDGTTAYLKSLKDPRIVLILKPQNSGIANSINEGLKIVKGTYIARMDGDDIASPDRLQKQAAFMDTHPDVVCCGGKFKVIDAQKISSPKLTHEELLLEMVVRNPIANPTAMIRASVVKENHLICHTDYEPAEDYKLFSELVKYGKLANLDEVLLHYRIHHQQSSITSVIKQKNATQSVSKQHIAYLQGEDMYDKAFYNYQLTTYAQYCEYLQAEENLKKELIKKGYTIPPDFFIPRRTNYVFDSLFPEEYNFKLMLQHIRILKEYKITLPFTFYLKYLIKTFLGWKRKN